MIKIRLHVNSEGFFKVSLTFPGSQSLQSPNFTAHSTAGRYGRLLRAHLLGAGVSETQIEMIGFDEK